jgi:transposase
VALVVGGKEINEVARDLGIPHQSLKQWCMRAKADKDQTQVGTMDGESASQREIWRLSQENDYLRRQRDILKKP